MDEHVRMISPIWRALDTTIDYGTLNLTFATNKLPESAQVFGPRYRMARVSPVLRSSLEETAETGHQARDWLPRAPVVEPAIAICSDGESARLPATQGALFRGGLAKQQLRIPDSADAVGHVRAMPVGPRAMGSDQAPAGSKPAWTAPSPSLLDHVVSLPVGARQLGADESGRGSDLFDWNREQVKVPLLTRLRLDEALAVNAQSPGVQGVGSASAEAAVEPWSDAQYAPAREWMESNNRQGIFERWATVHDQGRSGSGIGVPEGLLGGEVGGAATASLQFDGSGGVVTSQARKLRQSIAAM